MRLKTSSKNKYALIRKGYPLELYEFIKILLTFFDENRGCWCRGRPNALLTSLIIYLAGDALHELKIPVTRVYEWLLTSLNGLIAKYSESKNPKIDLDRMLIISLTIWHHLNPETKRRIIELIRDTYNPDTLWFDDPVTSSLAILVLLRTEQDLSSTYLERFVLCANNWIYKKYIDTTQVFWLAKALLLLDKKADIPHLKETINILVDYLHSLLNNIEDIPVDKQLWFALTILMFDKLRIRAQSFFESLYNRGKIFIGNLKELLHELLDRTWRYVDEEVHIDVSLLKRSVPDLISVALFIGFYHQNNRFIVYHITKEELEKMRNVTKTRHRLSALGIILSLINIANLTLLTALLPKGGISYLCAIFVLILAGAFIYLTGFLDNASQTNLTDPEVDTICRFTGIMKNKLVLLQLMPYLACIITLALHTAGII